MANEAGLKIVVGSDVSGALAGLNSVSAAAAKAGVATEQSFAGASVAAVSLANSLESTSSSFDEVAASSSALSRINASIDAAAASAAKAQSAFGGLANEAKEISQASVSFGIFNANAKQLPLQSIESFRKSVQQLKQEVAQGLITPKTFGTTTEAVNKTNAALRGTKGAANEAGQALTNVGRVAQDLPFGFIGIQNNLNPLLESFQRLKQSTGSTGTALKALAGSLVGAGGIGLALSVVSAAILVYQNGIAGFNSKTKQAKQEADAYGASLKSIGDEIGGQAARVTQLVGALESSNSTLAERSSALKELKGINNDYFGGLKEENGIVVGLSAAYDGYIAQLNKLGRAKAIQEQISKLFSDRLQLELNIDPKFLASVSPETQKRIGDLRRQLEALGGQTDDLKDTDKDIFADGNKNVRERIALQNKIRDLEGGNSIFADATYVADKKKIDDITRRIEGLQRLQDGIGEFNVKPDNTGNKASKEQDKILASLKDNLGGYQKQLAVTNKLREAGLLPIFRENDALELQLKILDTLNAIDAREVAIKIKPRLEIDATLNELEISKAIEEAAKRLSLAPTIPISPVLQIKPDVTFTLPDNLIPEDAFDGTIENMEKAGKNASDKLKTITLDITKEVESSFAGAAEAIGSGFGDILSGLGGAGLITGFANVLSDLLTQVGKMLIKTGVEILGLQKLVLKIANTPAGAAAAIAGGIAAIALAKILQNSVRDIKPRAFATGGLVNAPTLGLIGEAGPEVVLPLDRIPGLLNSAGGGNPSFNVSLGIRGRDLMAFIDREQRSFNRING